MLIVIFGAGASFDSNLDAPVKGSWPDQQEFRPPLANQLFAMDRDIHRQAAAAFPRSAPALQEARADVEAGLSIEAALQRLQDEAVSDIDTRAQLLALRFYIQRVLTDSPRRWDDAADGQTSYVSVLAQLARWAKATGERLALITFNYDDMLERAIFRVFGHRLSSFGDYLSHPLLHLYKPHGSVTWAYRIPWPEHRSIAQDRAIADGYRNEIIASDPPLSDGHLVWREPTRSPFINGPVDDPSPYAHFPALAIPVERKPGLVLPPGHEQQLLTDLRQAKGVISIGWRARERHVLDVLAREVPAQIALHCVAEDPTAALEAVVNLSHGTRFGGYALHTRGFAHFARPAPSQLPSDPAERRKAVGTIGPVLRQQVPLSNMDPRTVDAEALEEYDVNATPGPPMRFDVAEH